MNVKEFVIRVYGIYIDPSKGLLVSDELIKGRKITKFPGGGLEPGEGTRECLQREMLEETGFEFNILSHYYTTDFFIESVFDSTKQVFSIYYMMIPRGELKLNTGNSPFEFDKEEEGVQKFRYIPIQSLSEENFTLKVDRHVAQLLMNQV